MKPTLEQEIQAYYRKIYNKEMRGFPTTASQSYKAVQAIRARHAEEAELATFRASQRGADGQEPVKPVDFGRWV